MPDTKKTARMGRPPSDNPRRNAVTVKFTDDEYEEVRSFAERAKVPLSVRIREKSLTKERRRPSPPA